MIVVLQRVRRAAVQVAGETVGEIGTGLCLLCGAIEGDQDDAVRWLADKIAALRIFPDEQGKVNRSVLEVGGAALVVPQFTLAADWRKGRRPSFTRAAAPDRGQVLVELLATCLERAGLSVARGVFGADMEVRLANAGPFTMVLDSGQRPGGSSAAGRA